MLSIGQIRKNRKKVLGLNERFIEYIRPHNLRPSFEIADDKILTKVILKKHGIPVPAMIASIQSREELKNFDFDSLPKSFVIKPVHGVRGGGVEIFFNRDKNGNWIKNDGSRASINELKTLCRDILDGKYSLHNETDTVLIEERVKPHKIFRYHTFKGTPDVRVIVFNNIPVMSMLRLPTEKSKGRANLDQGAIGTGIDMAVGKTTTAIYGKAGLIEKIPHTGLNTSGLKIPYWDKILRYSIEASKVTKLGFAAVDFLVDKELGPLIVELNARPGLSIQLANQTGLRARLKKASGIKVVTTEKGIRLAKDLFGGEIEEEIEALSGKQVIGLIEKVKLFQFEGDDNKKAKVIEISKDIEKPHDLIALAKVDTGAERTSIDESIAEKLGYSEGIRYFKSFNYPIFTSYDEAKKVSDDRDAKIESGEIQEHHQIKARSIVKSGTGITIRPIIPITLEISGVKIETTATVTDRTELNYKLIIGQRDLKNFIIDPSKK